MTLWHFREGRGRRRSLLFSENKFSFINFPPVKSSRLQNVYSTDRFPFLWLFSRVFSTHVMWQVQGTFVSGETSPAREGSIIFHHLLSLAGYRNKNSLFQIRRRSQAQSRLLNDVHALLLRQMTEVPIVAEFAARLHLVDHLCPQ